MENFHVFVFFFILRLSLLISAAQKQVCTCIYGSNVYVYYVILIAKLFQPGIHIVYIGGHSGQKTLQEIEEKHHSYLFSVKETEEDARLSLIYSYTNNINGFAAQLTPEEASKLSEIGEVVSVFPSRMYSLHTTRSWDFTRLLEGLTNSNEEEEEEEEEHSLLKSTYGKDVIVGVIDTGVWPESQSFNDEGMGPIPNSWKGTCQAGDAFNSSHCNKKLIGARYYIKGREAVLGKLNRTLDYRSPRDKEGHGTHTSSTAAGRHVPNVSALGGYAKGNATGGAPSARLAIYKVCWIDGCFDSDIFAAIDDAIADGVNVLSISIGVKNNTPYHNDAVAIGTLHAVKKNIVVACSAGNDGPTPSTSSNSAPWMITVGASSTDRIFPAQVVLGNRNIIMGESITPYKLENKLYPLAYAGEVVNPNVSKNLSGQCLPGSLSPKKAKGKIILCFRGNGTRVGKGLEVKRAGGIGYILAFREDDGNTLLVDAHLLPATAVNYTNALKILEYINSTKEPNANIVPVKTLLGAKPSPFMAAFSSRGPNTISPDILKPDITAPGVNILAAWSEGTSPTGLAGDSRVVKYNIVSGTSMSCPHVAGALALLKGVHPDWSSAAIRSALMTTAGLSNNEGKLITDALGNPSNPFQLGSGYFRPTKAADPGLVYDASYEDYLLFLCSSGVTNLDRTFKCPKHHLSPTNLNYPSLAIPKLKGTVTVVRTVTNVGSSQSVYTVVVNSPPGISIQISPHTLYFNRTGQKMNFTIKVKPDDETIKKGEYVFGWFIWSDKIHSVQSPMAISVA